jgi:lipopolysaccharide/colanic/teichoic acid biosynthesis glycosyltransferase
MKRIFDLIVSFVGLVLFLPVFIIISLLIKLHDNGPVFFKQQRVGKDGKLFTLFKFRSMKGNELSKIGSFDPGDISRITKIGKFLRRTKLDELPQLFNVLIGDMSIVGPRPEVEKWITVYPEKWKLILSVKPGMTDDASIVFRREESLLAESDDPEKTYGEIILPQKLDLSKGYVLNNSFFGDLKLIFQTLYSLIFK